MKLTRDIANPVLTKATLLGLCLCAVLFLQGCNASMKNSVLGRSWTYMGGHEVVIAPCYWPNTKTVESSDSRDLNATYQFSCGKTLVKIKNQELFVDDKSYGLLQKGDKVAVESGVLRINSDEVAKLARR
ncbi:MAG: hypothetical protein ABR577_01390 [Pyrinomonadaceae bacterium]